MTIWSKESCYKIVAAFTRHWVMMLLVCTGIGTSVMFIPRGSELGQLDLAMGETEKALQYLEGYYAEGDRSPSLIAALAAARARSGNLPAAAKVVEQLLKTHPNDPGLNETLAGYYHRMGKFQAELAALKRLYAVRPSKTLLADLARVYARLNLVSEQRKILRKLVMGSSAQAVHLVELAKVARSMQSPLEGIKSISRLRNMHPSAVDSSVVALEVDLWLMGNRAPRAFERATQWMSRRTASEKDALAFASAFSAKGRPDLAARFLESVIREGASSDILLALCQAESDAGQGGVALERLEELAKIQNGSFGPELKLFRLLLAAAGSEHRRIVDAAEALGATSIPPDLIVKVAVSARRTQNRGLLQAIREGLEVSGSNYPPILTAEVYSSLGDRKRALSWVDAAKSEPLEDLGLAIRLARLDLRFSRTRQALLTITAGLRATSLVKPRTVSSSGTKILPSQLLDLAHIYIDLGLPEKGLEIVELIQREEASPEADRAWMLLASAARLQFAVIARLNRAEREELPQRFLRELIFLAVRHRSERVAVTAGTRLVQYGGTASDRLLLAELQVAAGVPWVKPVPLTHNSNQKPHRAYNQIQK